MSEPTTWTGRQIVATYGDALLAEVLDIEAAARGAALDQVQRAVWETPTPLTHDNCCQRSVVLEVIAKLGEREP